MINLNKWLNGPTKIKNDVTITKEVYPEYNYDFIFFRIYKSLFPALCVLSHFAIAVLMTFALLTSILSSKLRKSLTTFSAAIALLDTVWIVGKKTFFKEKNISTIMTYIHGVLLTSHKRYFAHEILMVKKDIS